MTGSEIVARFKAAKKVAIFAHKSPDPDAYGSMFAVREVLRALKKEADVFAVRGGQSNLDNIFPLSEIRTDFVAANFDLVVVVDLHLLKRLDACFMEEISKAKNIVVIDHHEVTSEGEVFSNQFLIQPEKAATCEILTELFVENKLEISAKTATYLWAGLVGDTGRFMHPNSTENVFRVASILLENGADSQFVYDKMYRSTPFKQMNLQKVFINKIKLVENGEVGYVFFTLKDLKRLDASREDIKKFTDEIRLIDGVKISFFGHELTDGYFKFSIRTNGANCVTFATKMGGGGHACASAFEVAISPRDIKKKLPSWGREILNENA